MNLRQFLTIMFFSYSIVLIGQDENSLQQSSPDKICDGTINPAYNDLVYEVPQMDHTEFTHRSLAETYGIPYHTDEDIHQKLMMIPSEIPLAFNPQVAQMIRNFVYTKRDYLTRMLTQSQSFFPIFEDVLLLKGVPLELKYLSIVESALKPHARSRCGATGLWQFMHYTAKSEGMQINNYIDERKDIYLSTEFAADYLKKLYQIHGDWFLALAAYNSGSGNVSKAIRNSMGYDFWSIKHRLPRETQNYVPSFIAIMYCLYYASEYHIYPETPEFSFHKTTRERIYNQVSLKYIAELVGSCEEELKLYNPSLKKGIIPQSYSGFDLVVPNQYIAALNSNRDLLSNDPYLIPISTDEAVLAEENQNLESEVTNSEIHTTAPHSSKQQSLSDIYSQVLESKSKKETNEVAKEKYKVIKVTEIETQTIAHKVKKGETLHEIAKKYGVTISDILDENSTAQNELAIGQSVTIVKKQKVVKPQYVLNTPTQYPSKSSTGSHNNSSLEKQIVHIVRKGENLMALCRQYGVSLNEIKEWNFLTNTDVKIGQEIFIYTSDANLTNESNANPIIKNYSYYEVQPGDTLQIASIRLRVPLETLKSLNNRDVNEPMKEGEKIKIPAL